MLNVLSLFSGIGAFERALKNKKIPYNLLAYCEIDKYTSKAYSVIHDVPESKNLTDVTQVDILDIDEDVDLITYGFPCQDISPAGNQKGFTDENGERTRSGLFFEALRIIDEYKPKFAIAENVKNLTSQKFKNEFKIVLESLDQVGYNSYWCVLTASDYGVPQARDRVVILSIRKDIDKGYVFPKPVPLTSTVKDILDHTADQKYYIPADHIEEINEKNLKSEKRKSKALHYINKLTNALLDLLPNEVLIADIRYDEGVRVRENGLSPTLTTKGTGCSGRPVIIWHEGDPEVYDIRSLTPWECFKLMGFTKEDCDKALSVASEAQVYKMAGNSIVVNVLEHLYASLGEIYPEFKGVE